MIRANRVFLSFIYLGILLLPITSLDMPLLGGIFRGIAEEASFYPIFLGAFFWFAFICIKKGKIYIPRSLSFYFLILFLGLTIVSGIMNINSILHNSLRDTYGLQRYVSLLFGFISNIIFVLFIYNVSVIEKRILEKVEKIAMFSFFVAGTYSVFEIGGMLGVDWMNIVREAIDHIIRGENYHNFYGKIRSICLEPSFFGIYIAFLFPWILSSFILSKCKMRYILIFVYLFLLVLLSGSRSIYVILILQGVVSLFLFWGYINLKKYILRVILIAFIGCFLGGIIGNVYVDLFGMDISVGDILQSLWIIDGESNLARYGSQIACVNMFFRNPFWGVGLGQYAYHIVDFMPSWAYQSQEISQQLTGEKDVWPVIHGLYARILAEMGIFALLCWCSIWGTLISNLLSVLRENFLKKKEEIRIKCLVISLIGILMFGFMHDSFFSFYYWIFFGIGIKVIKEHSRKNYWRNELCGKKFIL